MDYELAEGKLYVDENDVESSNSLSVDKGACQWWPSGSQMTSVTKRRKRLILVSIVIELEDKFPSTDQEFGVRLPGRVAKVLEIGVVWPFYSRANTPKGDLHCPYKAR